MKSYLIFGLIPIALLAGYLAPDFVNKSNYNVPEIISINLPMPVKIKRFSKSKINTLAFVRATSQSASGRKKRINNVAPISLEMIYLDKKNKMCKINGRIFRVGQHYKGITVVAIEKKRVLIRIGKNLKWLELKERVNEKI